MIVCICRNIKSSEFSSEEEMRDRIMQNDFQCGLCQTKYLLEKEDEDNVVQTI
jgi:hypothetical protein